MMTHHALPASEATRYRAGGLILAGVLTLALGWVIACWEVGGLPLGLLGLASAVAILLFTDEDGDTDTPRPTPPPCCTASRMPACSPWPSCNSPDPSLQAPTGHG
ncbi:hypothetical protein SAMN05192556_11510 [Halomonas caseinilytica]|uniref:Uncharacterized protein n=1 Tax=Halomonas caseinilytica TaxID=438744 RepID=A0A1M7AP04_9GAMM|nr:hypothetical protein SAMN05192556_11510 [Halomonas caseinilytica]